MGILNEGWMLTGLEITEGGDAAVDKWLKIVVLHEKEGCD